MPTGGWHGDSNGGPAPPAAPCQVDEPVAMQADASVALAAIGLAFLVSPFVAYAAKNAETEEFETPREPAAAG